MNQFKASERKTDVDMQEKLEKALRLIPAKVPPSGFFGHIREAIDAELQVRSLRRKAMGFAVGLTAFFAIILSAWNLLAQELAQSSFMEYLRVFWSDRDMVAANWSDATSSLLESLPVANLIIWLTLSFFAIGFVWMSLEAWKKSRPHNGPHHLAA